MTTISAKIIADSVSAEGVRLTTMQLRYPRFIHAELMTHRVFSRNARSSRAVPVEKMIQEVIDDPVIPIHWGAAQKGMQAYAECIGTDLAHVTSDTALL
jgi:thymidylate synthase ThyX